MFANYLLTLYRALTRHRLYAALNILGLSVGVAVFLVLTLFVAFQTSFERWIPNVGSIYVVRSTWRLPGLPVETANFTMGGLLEELKADYPQLLGTRLNRDSVTVRQNGQSVADHVSFVDPSFFQVFDLPMIAGDRSLADPSSLIMTESTARKYFGAASPLGRSVTISVEGTPHTYRVSGVLKDLPANTDLKIEMLARLVPAWFDADHTFYHWGSSSLQTFLKFPTAAQARALDADLDRFTDRHAAGRNLALTGSAPPHLAMHLSLAPLTSIHFLKTADAETKTADKATVATMGIVGLLTLLIAAVNYVNLATARAGLRAREVAMRKVLGATRASLVWQFLSEAVVTAAAAALIGLALAELALPLVNAAGGLSLRLDYAEGGGVLLILVGVVLAVGLGAGAYPALALSGFRPAAVLASARSPGGGRAGARVRELLVIAQFAIAIAFAIATCVLFAQTRFLQTADLGFKRDGLILVPSFQDSELTSAQRTSLLDAFRTLPGVVSDTQSDSAPGIDDNNNFDNMGRPGQRGRLPSIAWTTVGPDYFQTYDFRLIAGRWLDRAHRLDDSAGYTPQELNAQGQNVVLNAEAVRHLGFASPRAALGQVVRGGSKGARDYTVVGVVADARFHSPREPVAPMLYFFKSRDLRVPPTAAVRYAGADPRSVMARMQAVWRQIAPAVPFEAKTAKENLSAYYRSDQQQTRLFTIGAALAVMIGCLGLYGLASFNTARRTKEIGIRKTLGASTRDVLQLLVGQFLRPVLLANLIAWPLAYLAMRTWLSGFDQRIGLSPVYFIGATAAALAIATLTVIGQTLKVARSEPAKALRYE